MQQINAWTTELETMIAWTIIFIFVLGIVAVFALAKAAHSESMRREKEKSEEDCLEDEFKEPEEEKRWMKRKER